MDDERFYPAEPRKAYRALRGVVEGGYRLSSADDYSMVLDFESGMSAFTSGQRLSARVLPSGDGSLVRISGTGKLRTQVGNAAQLRKITDGIFDAVSRRLQESQRPAPVQRRITPLDPI